MSASSSVPQPGVSLLPTERSEQCPHARLQVLPAWACRALYSARVDPHLTAGCEVTPEVKESAIDSLIEVQHMFWQRVLGLQRRSMTVVLATETGVQPLTYRRVSLVLRYLLYLLEGVPRLPSLALATSLRMARDKSPSWISDIWHTLRNLPVPLDFAYKDPTRFTNGQVRGVLIAVSDYMQEHLAGRVAASVRLPLLAHRVEIDNRGRCINAILRFRDYLLVPNAEHRRALTRFMCAEHPLGIEQGRRTVPSTPRARRICRFFRLCEMVETEAHVLVDCAYAEIEVMREAYLAEAYKHVRSPPAARRVLNSTDLLRKMLSYHRTIALLVRLVHQVFTPCEATPALYPRSEEDFYALSSL
ncbi:hypothetical protein EIP86_010978 [Pleurotus ostreatoroseus]|nr:hypothetical protein EIP86_010978 [Pleurotus ostreatoroseus]